MPATTSKPRKKREPNKGSFKKGDPNAGRKPKPTFKSSEDAKDKGYCGAKLRQGREGWCGNFAGQGTEHPGYGYCRKHGGTSPALTRAAATEQAKEAVDNYGLPRDIDPHSALLEELARTAGHVAFLQRVTGELEQGAMVGPVGGGQGGFPSWEPSVWIRLYQAERKHLTQVAKTCVDVGIEERRIKLAEEQGELIARVINGVLGDLSLTKKQLEEAPQVVGRHLRLAAAGETGDGA